MVVLCIDPGLRNLAACIMNSKYEILLWENYNILDADDYKCSSSFKNGKICGRKCTMKHKKEQQIIFSCKTHFPKEIKKTKINDFKKKSIDKYLLQDIVVVFIEKIQQIYNENEELFKSIKSINIELQPKCNPKMLFISHIIYGKFIELFSNTIPIKFVRASMKLKAYTGPFIECHLKGAYAKRKWLSVRYAEWFLENLFSEEQRGKWQSFFLLSSKRDDRSDVLLMAINAITGIPKKQFLHKNGNEIK
jgi:hypothetical protein